MSAGPDVQVFRNDENSRYEAHVDGRLAGFAEFLVTNEIVVFTHTEVEPVCEGKGIGSALARFAMDDMRARDVSVLPLCPFIKGWIERHREYVDIVYGLRPSRVTD